MRSTSARERRISISMCTSLSYREEATRPPATVTARMTAPTQAWGNATATTSQRYCVTVSPARSASSAACRYARESPPAPSFVPPKYLVTTTITPFSFAPSIAASIGFPAVPDGSPSSFVRNCVPSWPSRYAKQWCVASKYSFLIPRTISSHSTFSRTGTAWARNREPRTVNAARAGARSVVYSSLCVSTEVRTRVQ